MAFNVRLARNPTSLMGIVLTTTSAVLFLIVFLADLFGLHTNPYIGIVFFLVLPGIFICGLVLIPIGTWLERRAQQRGVVSLMPRWPRLDLNDPVQRRAVVIFLGLTLANIVIVSLAAYRGIEYLDSVQFCGQTCHTVMQPESVAYQNGPHARVACVDCHVGGGASSFARSKLSGVRQLALVTAGRYPRPVPVPVQSLRPARDTCEQCHWPEKFHGDKIKMVREYADDAANTETVTTLRIHVGGGSERLGIATGIHWHMNLANEIEYVATDDKRQVIPYVRLKDRYGHVREYVVKGVTPEQLAKGERRRMDCMDCHSRPSHTMTSTAERAVDQAIAVGSVDRSLPFVRRELVRALKRDYGLQEAAASQIESALRSFYQSQGTAVGSRELDAAVAAGQRLYRTNVFPSMRVSWGTYANDLGHIDSPGCFRCHDDEHKTKDGDKIGQDCETCHHIEGS